jgi:hypothetical protein
MIIEFINQILGHFLLFGGIIGLIIFFCTIRK